MYDKNPNKETLAEEILCEMLQFLQYKIRNHKLTITDSDAIRRIFDGIEITGTADDFAKFYGQHPVTVRSVICRKYIGKPRRAVRPPILLPCLCTAHLALVRILGVASSAVTL